MDAAHEIFKKPFPVSLEFESVKTPENYRQWPGGADLPATMQVWKVYGKMEERNYGLVSDPYGFGDSPDCEAISSGINSKGPTSVAIGRQGNWFLWGFCAPPSALTPSARKVFLNSIAYIKRFDGQKPLVVEPSPARDWASLIAGFFAKEKTFPDHVKKQFSAALLEATGGDPKALPALVEANRKWLRVDPATKAFELDADVKALGMANDDAALLDRCVEMLEKGDRADLARKILARYVDATPGDEAKAWRKWLDANRAKLYFTDTGGYRFRVRT